MKIRVQDALRFLNATSDELKRPDAPYLYAAPFMFGPSENTVVMEPPTTRQLMRLHKELLSDVRDLLNGKRLIEIEKKINLPKPKSFIRFIERGSNRKFPGFEIDREHNGVTLDGTTYCVARTTAMETDLRKLVYGSLRDLLESGDFQRLGFCARPGCDNLMYHATRRPKFCSDRCRWVTTNHSAERNPKRRKEGAWYRKS